MQLMCFALKRTSVSLQPMGCKQRSLNVLVLLGEPFFPSHPFNSLVLDIGSHVLLCKSDVKCMNQ